ncbi:hypothetical protein OA095_03315 [Candidatus Pelagibacter sp.]|nr:hypothetical protein [Candidatus Pelagibacter sp.]
MSPLFRKNNFYDEPKDLFFFLRDFNKIEGTELKKNLLQIKDFFLNTNNSIVYLSPSYPFGRIDRFKNIPNLSEAIFWLEKKFKKKIDIKIIHLDRNIQESTLSSLGRGYTKNSRQACNHLYKSGLALDKQINHLKKKFKILKLDYNSFCNNPEKHCFKLSKFLKVKYQDLIPQSVISKQKRLSKIKDILIVKKFFEKRIFSNIRNEFNKLSIKPKIFIYHHMGLGDFISCNAIIRKFCNQNKEVFLLCKSQLIKNVEFMYRDLNNLFLIRIKDENEIDKFFKSINLEKKNYKIIELGFDNFYKTISEKFRNKDFTTDMVFYKQLNIPYAHRFKKTFWKRDLKNEKRVYKKLNPTNKDYIFVHDDPDRKLNIDKFINIKKKIKIIKNDKSEIIFNLGLTIERAKEIHIIESSIRHLIETLNIKHNKIFLYNIRKNLSRGPFISHNHKYVGTNKKIKIINPFDENNEPVDDNKLKKIIYRRISKFLNINERKFVTFKYENKLN